MRADRRPRKVQLPPPLPAGAKLGRYVVRNMLGRGAFGIVYRVTDPEDEFDLAIKEFLPATLATREGSTAVVVRSPAEAEAFGQGVQFMLNEGVLLSRIDHPSLIKVYGAWQENGTAYLAMDLSTGRNLYDTLRARWKSPNEASLRALLDSMLGAVDALHQGGLQHRDIAPQNILIEANWHATLMDLGSPRRVCTARGETGATGPRPGYAPIEGYGAASDHVRGPWTDIYSLGAIVYFLIAGKPPPPAPERSEDDRAGMNLLRPDLRHSFEFLAIVDWMLALQPADRPQSVAELRAALAGQGGVPARHAPPRRALWRAAVRRNLHWLWIGLGLLTASGLAYYVYRLWRTGMLPGMPG